MYIGINVILLLFLIKNWKWLETKYIFNVLVLVITLITSYKYKEGFDYGAYLKFYTELPSLVDALQYYVKNTSTFSREPLFYLISVLFKNSTISYFSYRLFINIGSVIILIYGINKLFKPPKNYIFLYLFSTTYMWFLYHGQIRQGLAISILILSISKIKNLVFFYLLVLLAVLIHFSSVVFLIVPFLIKSSEKRNNLILIFLLILMSLIFFTYDYDFVEKYFEGYLFYEKIHAYMNIKRTTLSIITSILDKIIVFVFVVFVKNNEDICFFKVYKFGFFAFLITVFFIPEVSGRFSLPFILFSLFIIANCNNRIGKANKLFYVFILLRFIVKCNIVNFIN